MRLILGFSVLLVVLIKFSLSATTYELEAKKFLDRISDMYYNEYNAIIENGIQASTDVVNENFKAFDAISVIAKKIVADIKEAKQFDLNKIHDPEIKNAFMKLAKIDFETYILGDSMDSAYPNIVMLNELATDRDISPYAQNSTQTESDDNKLAYKPDILDIFKKSANNEELKYYWKAWRDKNDMWATINFLVFADAFENVAKALDLPIMDYWYRFYSNSEFLKEMETVMIQLKPFYQQLHAFVRQELFKKYGADVVDPQGPIPDHLFRQVLFQAWAKDSVIESYFPFSELPPYNEFVKNYTPKKMLEEAEGFFKSLGFEPLDAKFWEHYTRRQDEENTTCEFNIVDSTPIVFLEYCPKVDFRKFLQSHSYMARVFYAKEKKNLPSYYFESYDLEYPVGESVILSASTPKHLTAIGLAKDFKFTDTILLNRLFRMGIHTMLHIPLHFVHSKIMNDFLNGTVDTNYLNQHYWKLMEEYVGVEPPMDRASNDFDFPYEFYKSLEVNGQTKKFVSEILGYQLYRALCKKVGQSEHLQNCDFYGHKEVGDILKSMMALGSSKPWQEVISKILPDEQKLSGNALLEYYMPVLDWVSAKNSKEGVKIGWNASKKHIVKFDL